MMDFSGFTADGVQQDNIAGILRFWKVITKAFTGEFPAKAHVVNGEVTADPLAFLPQYFVPAEYVVPNDTKSFDYELLGTEGSENWKHMVGYEKAGFSAAMVAEMMKDQNARSVFFMEDTDGNIVVVGTSVKGLRVTTKGGTGKQGGEKRGAVMTGEEVGYRWAPVPLSAAVRNAFLVRALGYGGFFQKNVYFNNTFTVGSTKNLQVGDDRGMLMPEKREFIGGTWVTRAGVAWAEADVILITKGDAATVGAPPRKALGLANGWCKAVVASFGSDSFVGLTVQSIGPFAAFTSNFVAFHKMRPTYVGLSFNDPVGDGFTGDAEMTIAGGAVLDMVPNTRVFLWTSDGDGATQYVQAVFTGQIGSAVFVTVLSSDVQTVTPIPDETSGYHLMEDVVRELEL